jgi:hypothetical protein
MSSQTRHLDYCRIERWTSVLIWIQERDPSREFLQGGFRGDAVVRRELTITSILSLPQGSVGYVVVNVLSRQAYQEELLARLVVQLELWRENGFDLGLRCGLRDTRIEYVGV